jgi:hypothetical protein
MNKANKIRQISIEYATFDALLFAQNHIKENKGHWQDIPMWCKNYLYNWKVDGKQIHAALSRNNITVDVRRH